MSRDETLLKSVTEFYENPEHSKILEEILIKKNKISLRTIEKFVTHDAKKNNIMYTARGVPFHVHVAYKASLGGYSKKYFDPFCRQERISFKIKNKEVVTTIAQLNFLRWCIKNDVLLNMAGDQVNN
jgi:hypothetical protein